MTDLRLRPAVLADAECLFAWRNDPVTRRSSFSQERIAWSRHVEWLASVMDSSATRLYVAEVDGQPVGTARIDVGDESVLSLTVAPEFRGQGIAAKIIQAAIGAETAIIAHIRRSNVASIRAFERAGFALASETPDVLTYRFSRQSDGTSRSGPSEQCPGRRP